MESVCSSYDQSKVGQTLVQRPSERQKFELPRIGQSWHQVEGLVKSSPMVFISSKTEIVCENDGRSKSEVAWHEKNNNNKIYKQILRNIYIYIYIMRCLKFFLVASAVEPATTRHQTMVDGR